jgi:hypothetical protein
MMSPASSSHTLNIHIQIFRFLHSVLLTRRSSGFVQCSANVAVRTVFSERGCSGISEGSAAFTFKVTRSQINRHPPEQWLVSTSRWSQHIRLIHQHRHFHQYNETNVMHFLFNLFRIKGLCMFQALLAHPQEVPHKTALGTLCVCYVSWLGCSQLT